MKTPAMVPTKTDTSVKATNEAAKTPPGGTHDWWAPIWKGLVLDQEGRHQKNMGSAVWLFAYFILCADRESGTLRRKAATIGRHMGVKTRTIRTWLKVLRRHHYIETSNSGRSLLISINKWKTHPSRHNNVRQSDASMSIRVTQLCQSGDGENCQKSADSSRKSTMDQNSNDITIKKDILNDNVDKPQRSMAEEDAIAWEICQAFKDKDNLPLYLSYVRKYPADIIRKAYQETMKLPANKIKKTRGALFNYLVKHYGEG